MKVYGATIKKQGVGKNGKQYTIVSFKDETGRKLDTFDHILLNVVDGQSVDGSAVEEQNGEWKNWKFKMAEKQSVPLQFKPVVPEESGADKAVAQKATTVPQEVWEKKDRAMAWMNCNNAAAQLFSGTGLMKEHIEHLTKLFDQYERDINGKKSLSENYAKVIEQVPPTPPAPVDEQPPAEIDINDIPF